MTGRRMMRPLVGIAVALGILLGSPGVAVAKTTSTPGYTYISWRDCAWTQAWLSDQGARPGLWSVGTMDWTDGASPCGNNTYQAPAGNIALMQNLMFWAGSQVPARWMICETRAPWVVNPVQSHQVTTGFGWASPPCGPNFYRSWSNAMSWDQPTGGWHSQGPILGNDWVIVQ
jgi:hypothetical protein